MTTPPDTAPRLCDAHGWTTVLCLTGGNSVRRAIVERRGGDGLHRFCVEKYFGPAEEDEGGWPDGFWTSEFTSGFYGELDEAKAAAADELQRVS